MNKDYSDIIKRNALKPKYLKNFIIAFVTGGLIGIFGQGLADIYVNLLDLSRDAANSLMSVTLILISALLTGFGVWDYFGAFAGAGAFVPITGFANAMTSAALEGKSEGITLGIGSGMFKLAGSVIAFGCASAYIVGILRYIFFGA
ncbi:MAG: stage sporulation protein [Haloplasmataceae bacterium]|jgi:stage V sporulation protein AC|nr:stage sporulation protein [Haloplasmataceae bacterium]